MSYLVFDTERTTRTSFKRKANPMDPRNWTVAVGWVKFGMANPIGEYYKVAGQAKDWLARLLADPSIKTLVGFNLKYDLHAAYSDDHDNYLAMMGFICRGGRIWDCQLAEYLLAGMHQGAHMLALDEVAPSYGGSTKVDEVKALWEAGVDTPDIPQDLLMRYLLGDGKDLGDISNAQRCFLGQAKRAKAAGQMKSIMLNMYSLLYTTEAEWRGMYVDKAYGLELAAELEKELAAKHAEVLYHIPTGLPFTFNLNSRWHLSPWLFGGKVNYDSRAYTFEDGSFCFVDEYDPAKHPPIRYTQMDELHYLLTDGTTIRQDLLHYGRLPSGKAVETFKGGKQAGEPKTKKVKVPDLTKPKTRMERRAYTFPGITTPDPKWAGADGLYSTAAEVIDTLVHRDQPFLKAFGEYVSIRKDLGTYFITTDEDGNSKGMLTLVGDDGLVHHKLNHTSTVTGRFSSSDPNLQNLPKGNKSDVKKVFKSRFGESGKIIQSDFTALEVYVQANLTHCKALVDDLRAGVDMHCMRLATKEKMDYDEVYRLCKGYMGPDGVFVEADPEWDRKRTKAKVFSFQRAYGAGAKKIAESTGMSIEEVQALIAAEEERYPEVAEFYNRLAEEVESTAVDVHAYQQHPDFPKVTISLRRGTSRSADGKLYSYKEQPAPEYVVKKDGKFTSFSPTELKNYVVQGGGAEYAKAAMTIAIILWNRHANFGDRAFLINQVHDACYVDAHESVWVEAAAALHACMEMASVLIERIEGKPLEVHVPSDTTAGPSMAVEDRITDPRFGELVTKYRSECQIIIDNLSL